MNKMMVASIGIIAGALFFMGVMNQQVQPPQPHYRVSVGKHIAQNVFQPMQALDKIVRVYAEQHGHYPKNLKALQTAPRSAKALKALKAHYRDKVGFVDAKTLLQSEPVDRHLLANQFNDGLVTYQPLESSPEMSAYRILRTNRLGDLLSRQDKPISFSNWLEPGKYLNLSMEAQRFPVYAPSSKS